MTGATWAVWKADWKAVRSADEMAVKWAAWMADSTASTLAVEKAVHWVEMLAGMSADVMAWTKVGQSADEKVAPWAVSKDARLVATWVVWKDARLVETKAVWKAGQLDSVDRKPKERSATMPMPTRILQSRSLS